MTEIIEECPHYEMERRLLLTMPDPEKARLVCKICFDLAMEWRVIAENADQVFRKTRSRVLFLPHAIYPWEDAIRESPDRPEYEGG